MFSLKENTLRIQPGDPALRNLQPGKLPGAFDDPAYWHRAISKYFREYIKNINSIINSLNHVIQNTEKNGSGFLPGY